MTAIQSNKWNARKENLATLQLVCEDIACGEITRRGEEPIAENRKDERV